MYSTYLLPAKVYIRLPKPHWTVQSILKPVSKNCKLNVNVIRFLVIIWLCWFLTLFFERINVCCQRFVPYFLNNSLEWKNKGDVEARKMVNFIISKQEGSSFKLCGIFNRILPSTFLGSQIFGIKDWSVDAYVINFITFLLICGLTLSLIFKDNKSADEIFLFQNVLTQI